MSSDACVCVGMGVSMRTEGVVVSVYRQREAFALVFFCCCGAPSVTDVMRASAACVCLEGLVDNSTVQSGRVYKSPVGLL